MEFVYYKARPTYHPFPIVAWMIMIFQGENPFNKRSTSHRALGYQIMETDWVVDSTGGHGVLDQTFHEFELKYKVIEKITFTLDIDTGDFCQWVAAQKGKKYDRLQILGLIFKILGFITFNKMGKNYKKLTCNELVLNFVATYLKIPVGDPDNWDMLMTDNLITEIKAGAYDPSMD